MGLIENFLEEEYGENWREDTPHVKVYFVPDQIIKKCFKPDPKARVSFKQKIFNTFGRGFAVPEENTVYVAKNTCDLELIAHEVGHTKLMGYKKHSWFLGIMNPTGLFRWFCNPIHSLYMFYKQMRVKVEYK